MIFNFGYPNSYDEVDSGPLFLNKLYEFACELMVASVTILWLMRHKLNFAMLLDVDHYSLFLGHLCASVCGCICAMITFRTVPNAMFCSSNAPCDCPEFFFPLYKDYCMVEMITTVDELKDIRASEGDEATDGSLGNLENLYFVAVGILMLVILGMSATFATNVHKKKKEEEEFREMKAKLEAQLLSKDKMAMVLNILGVDTNKISTSQRQLRLSRTDNINRLFEEATKEVPTSPTSSNKVLVEEALPGSVVEKAKLVESKEEREEVKEEVKEEKKPAATRKHPELPADHPNADGYYDDSDEDDDYDNGAPGGTQGAEEEKGMGIAMNEMSSQVMESLKIEVSEIQITDYGIAKGAFGEIHKGLFEGRHVALKTMLHVDVESMQVFKHEIILSAQLRHPNIVQLIGACWDPSLIALVMEFAEEGSLDECLKSNVNTGSMWTWYDPMLKIAIEIASVSPPHTPLAQNLKSGAKRAKAQHANKSCVAPPIARRHALHSRLSPNPRFSRAGAALHAHN